MSVQICPSHLQRKDAERPVHHVTHQEDHVEWGKSLRKRKTGTNKREPGRIPAEDLPASSFPRQALSRIPLGSEIRE